MIPMPIFMSIATFDSVLPCLAKAITYFHLPFIQARREFEIGRVIDPCLHSFVKVVIWAHWIFACNGCKCGKLVVGLVL